MKCHIAPLLFVSCLAACNGNDGDMLIGGGKSPGGYPLLSSNMSTVIAYPDQLVTIAVAVPEGAPGAGSTTLEAEGLLLWATEIGPDASDPSQEAYYQHEAGPFPYSYSFVDLSARHPAEIYVAGTMPGTGDTKIEKWLFPPQVGGYYTFRDTAVAGVGTPSPLSTLSGELVGGTYVAPENRSPVSPVQTTVFQGRIGGGVEDIAVDPEGRFLLILSATGSLYQLSDLASPTLTLLYDESALPGLTLADEMRPFVDAQGVRCFQVIASPPNVSPGAAIVLRDLENDGVIDETHTFTYDAYASSPYYHLNWTDDYSTYDW